MSDSQEHLINHYKKALLIKPDHPDIYNRLAECYYKQGQFEAAIEACKTALKFQPNLLNASKILAMSLQEQGEVEAAFELYQTLGDRLYKEEQLEEAITAYRCAIELKPNAYEAYYQLGKIREKQDQWKESIDCYLKVISCYKEGDKINPSFEQAYWKLIDVRKKCSFPEAISIYRKIVQERPNFTMAHKNLGDLLIQQGDLLTQQEDLKTAISAYKTVHYHQLSYSHPDFIKNYWHPQSPRQPNFLIIGIGKGGTSSLYLYLGKHPQILPAIKKETFFFNKNRSYGLDWYLAHFPPIPKDTHFLTGEATPWYLVSFNFEKEVARLFPQMKIIVLLRNPIFRAFSHYQMRVKIREEERAFSEVITSEIQAIDTLSNLGIAGAEYWQREKGYLLSGLYVYFLEKWMTVFPKEQFLILKSEDFYANPAATLTQVFEFLGVPDYPLSEYRNYNPGSYQPISDDLRQMLADFFRPHNQKLEEYLGMKFDWDE